MSGPVMVENGVHHSSSGSPPKLGDTQVLPSQVLADHLGNNWAPYQDYGYHSLQFQGANDTNDTGERTYATGDTGHVKLVQTQQSLVNTQPPDYDGSSDELAETSQTRTVTAASPAPLSPTTPALAGSKRDGRGNVIETITRTPAPDLAAAFTMGPPQQNFMGLSQVFNQTQADSSPFLGHLRSDPIFERPSPDMRIIQPTSSPSLASPIVPKKTLPSTAASESRLAYEPMKESQERRKRRSMTLESESAGSNDEDELGEDSEQQKIARRRSRELQKQKTMKEFASFAAPAVRLDRRKSSRRGGEDENSEDREDVIVISDDIHEEEELNEAYSSSIDGSVDVYDELSQAIIRTDAVDEDLDNDAEVVAVQDDQDLDELEVSQDQPALHESPVISPKLNASRSFRRTASSPVRNSQKHALIQTAGMSFPLLLRTNSSKDSSEQWNWPKSLGSQSLAIADSQPLMTARIQDLVPPPRPVMPSSITSRGFLSESQGFSLSSRTGLAITQLAEIEEADDLALKPNEDDAEISPDELNVTVITSSPPQVASLLARHVAQHGENSINSLLGASESHTPHGAMPSDHGDGLPPAKAVQPPSNSGSQTSRLHAPSALSQSIPETSPLPTPVEQTRSSSTPDRHAIPLQLNNLHDAAHTTESGEGPRNPSLENLDTTETFATARTLPFASKKNSGSGSRSSHNTPQKPRIRKFTEITEDLQPPEATGEEILHTNILDQDDLDFHAVIEGSSPADEPPTKRPRRFQGKRSQIHLHDLNTDNDEIQASQSPPQAIIRESTDEREDVAQALPASPRNTNAVSAVAIATSKSIEAPITPERGKARKHRKGPSATVSSSLHGQVEADNTVTVAEIQLDVAAEVAIAVNETTTEQPVEEGLQPTTDQSPRATAGILRPERVLARFRGVYMAYYPATCLGPSTTQPGSLIIRFDEGTIDEIDVKYIIHFELRKGDIVKVDVPKLKAKSWIVHSLENNDVSDSPDSVEYPKTDMQGNNTVCLKAKPRQSLGANGAIPDAAIVKFPLANVYIPTTMTVPFKDRYYRQQIHTALDTRLHTPVPTVSMPTTPSSRGRRSTFGALGTSANFEGLNEPAGSKSGLFANMTFAISYSPQEEPERNRIRRLLQGNGAQLLNEGFDELFEVPSQPIISPSKIARQADTCHEAPLALATPALALGFTALIADAHSRRAKYMQALALNLPCLSGRWVIDSCTHSKVLPWDRYLLPAGESSYLGGAVRSRTFPPTSTHPCLSLHDPATTSLTRTIENRPKMLAGKNVMLVMGESKADDKRKPYLFLTFALGAERVQRVKGINAAKTFLQQDSGHWDLVYVGDCKLAEAKKELHGLVHEARDTGKKRKRAGSVDSRENIGGKRAKLIGDEFVIQSLILGALMEED